MLASVVVIIGPTGCANTATLNSAHSGLDGCIAERVAYEAASVQVNVDVPTQTRVS